MYNTTSIPFVTISMDTPMAIRYLGYVYNTPTGHPRCFVFDRQFESCEVSERQNQSVVNAFSYVLSHPPVFSFKKTIGVGLCDNLANEQIKVSFY